MRLQNPKQLWNRTYFQWAPDPKSIRGPASEANKFLLLVQKKLRRAIIQQQGKDTSGMTDDDIRVEHKKSRRISFMAYRRWPWCWYCRRIGGRDGRPHGDLSGGGNSASPSGPAPARYLEPHAECKNQCQYGQNQNRIGNLLCFFAEPIMSEASMSKY